MAKSKKDKDKGKKDKGGKGGGGKKDPKVDIYDPRSTLDSKSLKKLANKLANVEYKPQIGAARSQAKSLKKLLAYGLRSNQALTKQASGNVESYYGSLKRADNANEAYQKALGSRLTGAVGDAGTQAQNAVASAGGTANANLSGDQNLRRVDGTTARDQLQAAIASESGRTAREGQALGAQAAGQSAAYQAMQQQMASAAQMQGGVTMGDIAKRGQENEAKIQSQYGPSLIEARQNVKDIRSTRGDAKTALIRQLIGEERDYLLSKGALGVDKAGLSSGVDYAKVSGKQNRKSARVSGRQSRKTIDRQAQNNAAQARLGGRQSRKTIGKQQRGYGNGGGGKGKGGHSKAHKRDLQIAKATAANIHKEHPQWDKRRIYNELLDTQGVNPNMAKKVLRMGKHSKWRGISRDPNGRSLGR